MALSAVEALRRAAGAASPTQLPGANTRSKFHSLRARATPAENPRRNYQCGYRAGPLIWIPDFLLPPDDRLTISPRVGLVTGLRVSLSR